MTEPRPTKSVINCETNITTIVELTDEEIAQLEADRAAIEAERAAIEADRAVKEAARQSGIEKLIALGLTEEEAEALVK